MSESKDVTVLAHGMILVVNHKGRTVYSVVSNSFKGYVGDPIVMKWILRGDNMVYALGGGNSYGGPAVEVEPGELVLMIVEGEVYRMSVKFQGEYSTSIIFTFYDRDADGVPVNVDGEPMHVWKQAIEQFKKG